MGKRITQKQLEQVIRDGNVKRHACGDNLYLNITAEGTPNWAIIYDFAGKRKYKGLGAYDRTSNTLAMARTKCDAYRVIIKQGADPRVEEQNELDAKLLAESKQQIVDGLKKNIFESVAYELIEAKVPSWTSPKSRQAWENTLKEYAFPVIGHLPVDEIDKSHILKILEPIWISKYETARKLRQRIEQVFSRAIYFDMRKAGNPAAYKDNLEIPLPIPKNRQVKHHPALSYKELPEYMCELRTKDGIGARALEFLILNGNRTTEVRKAKWSEFNLKKRTWTIQVEIGRLGKTKKPHIVPLSDQSVELILSLSRFRISEYVFPNIRSLKELSVGGMDSVIKRMHKERDWTDDFGDKITVHGFRSTMRDFVAEQTDFDEATAETVLAHTYGNAVERAYRRGDLLDKRRKLMQCYSDYACATPQSKVIPITG